MKIFGVALLAACYLAGQLLGEILGHWLRVEGNVGGVGFSMLGLILLTDWMKRKGYLEPEPEKGILFWSALYIPIVIAMSATQNVQAALKGGWVALLAGAGVTAICFLLIPLVSLLGKSADQREKDKEKEGAL